MVNVIRHKRITKNGVGDVKRHDRKIKEFESREVFKKSELPKKLYSTGYEAYRVSPRTTTKYGKKYKRIYGATVEPDYQRPTSKKHTYGAKVSWYPHGFASASTTSGTKLLDNLKNYPINVKEARIKLMVKKRRKR